LSAGQFANSLFFLKLYSSFGGCAIRSMDDLDLSVKNNSLVPSMAHEMAASGAVRGAIMDVVTEHFNSDMSADAAAAKLADAVAAAK
jgi:glucose/mannose transport system substrate-binding protein